MRPIYLLTLISVLLVACREDKEVITDLNNATYEKAFLWSDARTSPSENILELNWNIDAIDANSMASLQLVDKDMQPLSEDYVLKIDGEEVSGGRFVVNTTRKELNFSICCKPGTAEGRKDGYLILAPEHTLDRINEMQVTQGQMPKDYILHWSFKYGEEMNHILRGILVCGCIVLALMVIWFVFLKPIFSPTFGHFRKRFSVLVNKLPVLSPRTIDFKDCKEFRLTSHKPKKKQSTINRLFTRKIEYLEIPQLKSDLIFKPKNKKYCYIRGNYSIPSSTLPKVGGMTIKNNRNNIEITIN